MAQEDQLEAMGIEMAQRKLISFLTIFYRESLQFVDKNNRDHLLSTVELRLNELRGEFLYPAPLDLPAKDQQVVNQSFQHAFSETSAKVIRRLREPYE